MSQKGAGGLQPHHAGQTFYRSLDASPASLASASKVYIIILHDAVIMQNLGYNNCSIKHETEYSLWRVRVLPCPLSKMTKRIDVRKTDLIDARKLVLVILLELSYPVENPAVVIYMALLE